MPCQSRSRCRSRRRRARSQCRARRLLCRRPHLCLSQCRARQRPNDRRFPNPDRSKASDPQIGRRHRQARSKLLKGAIVRVVVGVVVLASALATAGVAGPTPTTSGWLAGQTQISFGCPGPAREGEPSCQPWHTFPHARFSVAQRRPAGAPPPGLSRVVVSDGTGQFQIRLATGTYTITPLAQPQRHTRGGTPLTVQVHPHTVTRIPVRFIGFPMML